MKSIGCRGIILFGLLNAIILYGSCSQPVLESAGCAEARDTVKRLYSIHLDQGPNPNEKKLESLRKYISAELFKSLTESRATEPDYLTQHSDFPKAFRVGSCRDTGNGPEFDVLLFWRRGERNSEETIVVQMLKENAWKAGKVRKNKKVTE